jgi:hypothetical protein
VKTVLTLVLLAFAGSAGAADSPAQIGYCVESLSEYLTLNSQAPPSDGVTPKSEADFFSKMQQEQDAKVRPYLSSGGCARCHFYPNPTPRLWR